MIHVQWYVVDLDNLEHVSLAFPLGLLDFLMYSARGFLEGVPSEPDFSYSHDADVHVLLDIIALEISVIPPVISPCECWCHNGCEHIPLWAELIFGRFRKEHG